MPTPRSRLLPALLAAAAALHPAPARAWGLVAHRIVTETAAERVPPDAAPFFRAAVARLSDLSLEPDTVLKAREGEQESRRHFINLDALEPYPFEGVPREYAEAAALYGEAKVRRGGTLPWRIANLVEDLTRAMRRPDAAKILEQAGHLSHYVADAHQPLHLTKNHDGQATCNQGIHAAFEGEMIERHARKYRDALGRSRATGAALERPGRAAFGWMRETYPLVEKVLAADTVALRALKNEGKDYYEELDRQAGPIAEDRMSAAATAVASMWYTAWIAAGKPALPKP